jgi:hypothetical protein
MKNLNLREIIIVFVGSLMVSAIAQAGVVVINDEMPRRGPGSTSGSGDTVEANCAADPGGDAWQGATADLMIKQSGGASTVDIDVKNAVPNTVFTVWLRMRGTGPDGSEIGWHQLRQSSGGNCNGSPLTCGGATPLAPGYKLDEIIHYTPPNAGTSTPTNGFTTDKKGKAHFSIDLDFPVVGGAYPFHLASATAVADWQAMGGNPDARRIPTAVVDPSDVGIGGPFLLRVISHCTDQQGHGLSPAVREAWFQYP